jgi:poly(3-hydroxybutyrate) depolymerase
MTMMRNTTVVALLIAGLLACGSNNSGGGGASGGATSTGGTTGSGGIPGTGGKSGAGGAAGANTGTGGATAAGGASGTGGMTGGATGAGLGGSAGRTGAAGASGRGGASANGGETGNGGASGAAGQSDAGSPRDATTINPSGDASVAKEVAVPSGDAADAKPVTSTCTGSSTLKAGDNKSALQFGGRSRSYTVYVPSSIKSGTAVPLIFDFHGHGGNASQEESSSGWKKKADQVGAIMVYPEGVDSSWNVGNCCGQAMSENVDDVGFTKAIIEAVSKAACIDAKRIYATGMSNGAGFVHRLGCEAADVIAAIGAASADLVTDPCTPVRPISEISIRGLSDTTVAYAGLGRPGDRSLHARPPHLGDLDSRALRHHRRLRGWKDGLDGLGRPGRQGIAGAVEENRPVHRLDDHQPSVLRRLHAM